MQNYEKNSYFTFLALNLVAFFASAQISISSSCGSSTINVTSAFVSGILYLAQDKYYTKSEDPCRKVLIFSSTEPLEERYSLQRQNPNLTWTVVSTLAPIGGVYTGLSHGTYRVEVSVPSKVSAPNCKDGIRVFAYETKWYGYVGAYTSAPVTSNTVYIGATDQNDIKFNWIKTMGTPAPPNLASPPIYCFQENPKINTTGTLNYDRYWVAIFETGAGASNRYTNTGWIFGKIPGNQIDLLYDVWKKNNSNWEFTPNDQFANASYSVQFAISNSCNSGWTTISNPMPFFQRRPQGWVCRNTDDDVAIAVSPNPANGYFKIPALETGEDNIQISVTDMTGRLVKQYNNVQTQYEVSDLSNGIYVINILRQGVRIHSSKLSVLN